ncbi:MAG: NUDIX hydrolase [Pseudorhodoplanes sp.]|nr:MAG: NUDIX hydrolase [Pseudorhodoplanes sp.]MBZ0138819.1 NUDIX hydrolase [Pseudorhodoplanes sp.]
MNEGWPRILARRTTRLSPWAGIIERDVAFAPGEQAQTYHAVIQPDYIAMLARTPDGRIPLVRQYRPALEAFTWELPAGTVDPGETAAAAAARELLEETGHPSLAVHLLGTFAPCSGRLANKVHSFFIEAGEAIAGRAPETGIAVRLVTPEELAAMIKADQFDSQQHLGTLMLARLHGFLDLPVA